VSGPAGSGGRAAREGWRVASLWPLIYLAFLAFQPAYDPRWWQWPLAAGVALVFVPFYVLAQRAPGSVRRSSVVVATVAGVLVVPFNAGASVLFVYAASFAGSYLPRRAALQWFIALTFLLGVQLLVSEVPFPYRAYSFTPSLLFIWVIGLICLSDAQRDRESARLRLENARIEHLATLTERERISRDLHDVLGQTLTGIVVRAQLAQRLGRIDPDKGAAEMAEVERAARAALGEVRATVSGWRQVVLDDELVVARDALAAAGVELTVSRDPEVVLTPSAESALAMALREAVTNVVRHAHASRCTVALRRVDGRVALEVADDGVGGEAAEGNGLTGMRERIAALGGEVQRLAAPGTALTVVVPAVVAT
jgi:two-component system sensor histidine kinase DesK